MTTVKLYSYDCREVRTYAAAFLFVTGNIIVPQLFHLLPHGGMIWLPIYFFTLIGAYKYGWQVGLITALASPLANAILFDMPAMAALPAIITKSVLLALGAGYTASRCRRLSIPLLVAVVLFYQLTGTLAEWLYKGSLFAAMQDFRIGLPGMVMQVTGGYLFIKHILKR